MKKSNFIFSILCTISILAHAQTYPVSANVRIQKPYSIYLSDYKSPGDERMSVILLLKDANEPFYDVRLRVKIRGAGIALESKPNFTVSPITLQAGTPLTLLNEDFAVYLDPRNLIFKGITQQEFLKTGALPEGLYEISWQVYDYRRTEVSLSNQAITTAWIVLNNPPIINTPLADEKLKPHDPQNIRFSWQPNGALLNGDFTTEYLLELYEMREPERNRNEVVRSSKPIATITTANTSLTYGASEPTLIPGMKYAFRVQARDIKGRETYKNNGYSEVRTFIYGNACLSPKNISIQETSAQWVQVQWEASPTATQYVIRYREANNTDAAWFEDQTFATSKRINNLKPDTSYEYQILCRCGTFNSEYTSSHTFTTPGNSESNVTISCKPTQLSPPDLDVSTALPFAQPGNMFKVGHFYMKVNEVSGGAGTFSGKGEIFVPFLSTTLRTTFHNLLVNAESQVIGGSVTADFVDYNTLSASTINHINSFQPKFSEICIQYNAEGYDKEGYNQDGYDREGYDREGYDTEGYDKQGFNRDDFNREGYDKKGYDQQGYDKEGYDRNGVNRDGLDRQDNPVGQNHTGESGTSNASTSQGLSSSISDHDLEKIIKKYLKELRKQNKDSIDAQRKQVEELTEALNQAITAGRFDRKSILGLDKNLTGEGMSLRIKVNEIPDPPSSHPAYHMRMVRRKLYDTDVKLQTAKARLLLIEQHLDAPAAVTENVRAAMQELSEEKVNTLKANKASTKIWIHEQVDLLINKELSAEDRDNLGSSNTFSDGLVFHNPFINTNQNFHLPSFPANAEIPSIIAENNEFSSSLIGDAIVSRGEIDPAMVITPNTNQAYLLHQIILDENRKRGSYSVDEPMDLPVGIGKVIGNTEYLISIGAVIFTPAAAYMDVYMGTEIPWSGDWLTFQGENIEIFPEGFGGEQNRLSLAQDVPVRLNNNMRLTLKGGEQRTYLHWDCQGFRKMNVQGEIEFCPGLLVPEKEEQETVKAYFETSFQEWGDFIAQISIDPFQVKGLKDFTFEVSRAYADFSDLYNPTGIAFPKDYQSAYLNAGIPELWQGFYLQNAKIKLPAKLDKGPHGNGPHGNGPHGNGHQKELYVENLIIDDQGVSGLFSASGIIPDGSLNGWDYSVDQLSLHLIKNKLKKGSMQGGITLPIMDEKDTLGYSATIASDGNWLFNVHLREKLTVPLWQADMDILPSSFIEVREEDNQFVPRAVLNGSINIEAPLGENSNFSLSGIQFEQLTLSSERPYFNPGTWSLNEVGIKDEMAGFSLTLTGIQVFTEPQEMAGLAFTARLSLMKEQIAATTGLRILGHLEGQAEGQKQHWYYDKTEINKISIDSKDGPVGLKGYLTLFDGDPVYGEGFAGAVQANFTGSFTVGAKAQFGRVNDTRYWYVDANVKLDKAIPIAGTGLGLYGFGGGAYYHMKRQRVEQVNLTLADDLSYDLETGTTPSGIRYIPDPDTHLGIKAAVIFGTAEDPRPFNGDVGFEVAFNKGGGISQAGFTGNGYFMSDLEVNKPRATGALYAGVNIFYDFQNAVLHGNCKVYVNAAGGLIRGSNAGNLAGEAVLHFSPQDWYIHIGKPSARIGLTLSVPIKQLPLAIQTGSYFMVGTQIEPMPDPPAKVMSTLERSYEHERNENDLIKGKGFAFGSDFSVNTGKLQVAMFYGQLEAGTGFDVMLMNHSDKICAGRGDQPGIEGWYAEGQAYAYLEGAIGIRVTVFKVKVEEEILRIGAATLLQAALPNPFWLKGDVGGYYSLLGGKVSGKCNFGFEIGQQCLLQSTEHTEEINSMESLSVISELTPANNRQDIDVFTAPQAVFNLPINESFTLVDTIPDHQQSFRIRLDHFRIMEGEREIAGTYEWNERNDVVAFNPHDILPGNKKLRMEVQVSFEENKGGLWKIVQVNHQKAIEKIEYTFTTGETPDYIPEQNVFYSYPVNRQLYFLPKEHNQGSIQLDKGQNELFKTTDEWRQIGRLTAVGQNKTEEFRFTYKQEAKRVELSLPSDLRKEQIYLLELVNVPAQTAGGVDHNISEQVVARSQNGQDVTIKTNQAEGDIQRLQEKVLYSFYFRTSRYNTFAEKLTALEKVNDWQWAVQTGVQEIGRTVSGTETFDRFEIEGTKNVAPLVNLFGGLGSPWHKKMDTLIYFNCVPFHNQFSITWRNHLAHLGTPPVEAMTIDQSNTKATLTDEAINTGLMTSQPGRAAYVYQLPYYMYYDYYYLQQAAANAGIDSPHVRYILEHPFIPIYRGDYTIYAGYRIPGDDRAKSLQHFYIIKP